MRYGDIELDSGRWKWTVTELHDGTEGYVAGARPAGDADPDRLEGGQTVLVLEDPTDPEHWMTRELPRNAVEESIPDEELKALAADPDRRIVQDPEGTVWKIEPIEPPEGVREEAELERAPCKVRVSSNGGPERTLSLPEGEHLGAVSREELIRLVRS